MKVERTAPRSLVVKEDRTAVYLYPERSAPQVLELEQGRIVRVRKTYGDGWYLAEVTMYDVPGAPWGWLKKESLAAPGKAGPKEGTLKKGSVVYTGWDYSQISE